MNSPLKVILFVIKISPHLMSFILAEKQNKPKQKTASGHLLSLFVCMTSSSIVLSIT